MGSPPLDPDAPSPHVAVFSGELREFVAARTGDVIVDGTFGAGGHSRVLLDDVTAGHATAHAVALMIGVDRDPSVETLHEGFAREAQQRGVRTRFIRMPYPEAFTRLREEGVSADVVILDIGVSSMQLDQPERGFAYSYDAPLDMRMDTSSGITAAELVATATVGELTRILREYGEERFASRIAAAIDGERVAAPITRTGQLADIVRSAIPAAARRTGGHPAKRTFQALRIAVNDELSMLDRGLDAALALTRVGGRIAVISFHSLEDRMVKRRFESWMGECVCPPGLPVCGCGSIAQVARLTKRAVRPSQREIDVNPRAASARLRAVRVLGDAT